MAFNATMRLTGQRQGEIKGSVTQPGREGSILVIGFNHEVVSPRDAASGLPTGKRQHKPILITKEIDKSSPLLMNALVNNEGIKSLELRFWREGPSGKEVQHYTIQLVNASIAGIRQEMLNNAYPENLAIAEREIVSFTYERISWTFEDGAIVSRDDWAPSNA